MGFGKQYTLYSFLFVVGEAVLWEIMDLICFSYMGGSMCLSYLQRSIHSTGVREHQKSGGLGDKNQKLQFLSPIFAQSTSSWDDRARCDASAIQL